jgi:uncharacterized protein YgbK (DUF1537 family)
MILGVIADDFTGATDVASMLVREGMRTVQVIGVPAGAAPSADAVVVALKSRTVPAAEAVAESLAALRWLQAAGARQIYFKYCSTFDSTPAGNIGPVAEALLQALGAPVAIACPAFPENGRTVFRGHLFVGDQLLSDSGMRDHPLTPMTDSNLVRVLQAQSTGRWACCATTCWPKGADAARARWRRWPPTATRWWWPTPSPTTTCVCWARSGGRCAAGHRRLGRGAGPAGRLCARAAGCSATRRPLRCPRWAARPRCCRARARWPPTRRCSTGWTAGRPALRIDARALAAGDDLAQQALAWAAAATGGRAGAGLRHRRAGRGEGRAGRTGRGPGRPAGRTCLAPWRGLVAAGVRRLVVAGGETSGAVVQALDVQSLRIGAPIDPGVPWTQALAGAGQPLLLALKSGNFGGVDFFAKALGQVHDRGMRLRAEICRVGRSLFERGYVHATAGNISVRLPGDAGFLITPTDACLGPATRPAGPCGRWTARSAAATAPARRWRCTGASTARPERALRDPHPQHPPGGADAGRRVERRRHPAADHAVLT